MNQELDTLIKERYKLLPDNLRKAISSIPLQDIIQEIATQNGLHVDQSGGLYVETMLIMLGVEKINDFERNLKNNIGVDSVTAKNLEIEINDKVFLSVRETLKKIQGLQESELINEDKVGNRDSILSEIENPQPVEHPISAAKTAVPEPSKDSISKDFVTGKLSETVNMPAQKMNPDTPIEKPKGYSNDPYREPLA